MAIERMGRSNGGKGGRIVNVASVAGFTVSLDCNYLDYKKHNSVLCHHYHCITLHIGRMR